MGLVFAALCVLTSAFFAPVARFTTERLDPLFVAAATTFLAGLAALVVLGARGRLGPLLRGPNVAGFIALGLLGTVVPNLCFFLGTGRTSALDAIFCLQVEPAYSLVLAWAVLGHRLTLRRVASVVVIMLGIALAIGNGESTGDPIGLGLLLLTPLAWQISHLVALKRLRGVEPELLTGARYVWGGLVLVPVAFALGHLEGRASILPSAQAAGGLLPVLVFQGVVLSYLGTQFWYKAISRLDLARATSIVVPSIPLVSFVASYPIVGEIPSLGQLVGVLVATAGVLSFVFAPHAVEVLERIPSPAAPLAAPAEDEAGGDVA